MNTQQRMLRALNKVTKWRNVFQGWQLGTRSREDPEGQAVRDHREVTILLRIEVSALTAVLVDKGIISLDDFQEAVIKEAVLLDKGYERRFPGISTTEYSIEYDVQKARETMKDWPP